MIRRFTILFFAAMVVSPSQGRAEPSCSVTGTAYDPTKNSSVTVAFSTDAGGCDRYFRANGRLVITSTSISSAPKNGTLSKLGSQSFRYRPKAGFRGEDGFTVEVCGTVGDSSGCSKVAHRVRVD